jgi:hypothetical protein
MANKKTGSKRTISAALAVVGALAVGFEAGAAAQGQPSPAPASAGCFPPCRSGYLCSPTQQCVSACNPVCPQGQECTDSGQCVPSAAPAAGAYTAPAGSYPSAGIYQGAPPATAAYTSAGAYAAAPTPRPAIEDAKDRRRHAHAAWSVYAGLGGGETKLGYVYAANGEDIATIKHEGATFVGGVGVRSYFTRIMGMQARASILVGQGKGVVLATPADATLRLGPFGEGFPWFFGLGPFVGAAYGQRTGTDTTTTPSTQKTGSTVTAFGGGVAETGFLFGDGDRLEIAARGYVGAGTSSNFGDVVEIVLGAGYRF